MGAWQVTFFVVGFPGILVVLLLLLAKEPVRHALAGQKVEAAVALSDVARFMRHRWQVYTALFTGVSAMSIVGYGTLTWYAEFLLRTYQMPRSEGGPAMGSIFLIAGTAGTLCGAWFASLLQRKGYEDANMRLVMLAALAAMLPAAIGPLMSNGWAALLLAVPVIFFHYTHFGVAVAALQLITANRMRALISALMLFATNLFGLGLGGSIVAFFTDYVFGDDSALRYSLALVGAVCYLLSAVLIGWGLKYYRAEIAALQDGAKP